MEKIYLSCSYKKNIQAIRKDTFYYLICGLHIVIYFLKLNLEIRGKENLDKHYLNQVMEFNNSEKLVGILMYFDINGSLPHWFSSLNHIILV